MHTLTVIAALLLTPSAQANPGYAVVDKIPIGGEGGWDCIEVDSASHRLFISRGSHVMVLDLQSKKLVGDIPNTNGVHDIALVPKLHKGYISDGRDDAVTVFDLRSLKEIKRIPVGSRPDVMAYDRASNRVFTLNGGSSDATAIDPATDTVAGTVKLDGKPEFAQADGRGVMYVNIEDKSEIQKLDTKALKVTGSWPIAPGEEPTGLAFDTKHGLLFSACGNGVMAVSDAKAGKVIATPKIGNGPDGAGYDASKGLAFIPNGQDGTLTVLAKTKAGSWEPVQTVPTQTSARTMALDPATHRVYLIAATFEKPTDPNSRRRTMVPGSATILVVGPTR